MRSLRLILLLMVVCMFPDYCLCAILSPSLDSQVRGVKEAEVGKRVAQAQKAEIEQVERNDEINSFEPLLDFTCE